MIDAVAAGAGHPVVAGLLGLGSAGLAAGVVAMTWSVHARQIRLAEVLARRQFISSAPAPAPGQADPDAQPDEDARPAEGGRPVNGHARAAVIDGPETVVTGEQARYRVRSANDGKVVSWAVGGGSVAQTPDPSHPDELLLIADQPGNLTISVRVREGMTERRETKAVAVMAEVPAPGPPFTLRLFLHGWGLVVAAILIAGFAGALGALGTLTSAGLIPPPAGPGPDRIGQPQLTEAARPAGLAQRGRRPSMVSSSRRPTCSRPWSVAGVRHRKPMSRSTSPGSRPSRRLPWFTQAWSRTVTAAMTGA